MIDRGSGKVVAGVFGYIYFYMCSALYGPEAEAFFSFLESSTSPSEKIDKIERGQILREGRNFRDAGRIARDELSVLF